MLLPDCLRVPVECDREDTSFLPLPSTLGSDTSYHATRTLLSACETIFLVQKYLVPLIMFNVLNLCTTRGMRYSGRDDYVNEDDFVFDACSYDDILIAYRLLRAPTRFRATGVFCLGHTRSFLFIESFGWYAIRARRDRSINTLPC